MKLVSKQKHLYHIISALDYVTPWLVNRSKHNLWQKYFVALFLALALALALALVLVVRGVSYSSMGTEGGSM